ncbi:Bridging integrator 3, variant 2 [Chamberlinius hualienensis]
MSWNPLQKLFSHDTRLDILKELPVTPETREVEEQIKRFNKYVDVSRALCKEAKQFSCCIHELSKCENKLTRDLSQSGMCQCNEDLRILMEEYHSVTANSQEPCDDLIYLLQKTLIEPLKSYRLMFTNIEATLRKRDSIYQEFHKNYIKVEKLKTKEKTGKNIANLEISKKSVGSAQKEIAILDQQLLKSFPDVFKARLEYFQPCIEALIGAKVTYSKRNIFIICQFYY